MPTLHNSFNSGSTTAHSDGSVTHYLALPQILNKLRPILRGFRKAHKLTQADVAKKLSLAPFKAQ